MSKLDDLEYAKRELLQAKQQYRDCLAEALNELGGYSIKDAIELGYIRLNFSVEGLSRNTILDMMS